MNFLKIIPFCEAKQIFSEEIKKHFNCESVSLNDALFRIVAKDILSPNALPLFDRSLFDGYAIKADSTFGAKESLPSILTKNGEIKIGEKSSLKIEYGECVFIPTGGMLPQGADSVIKIEDTSIDNNNVFAYRAIAKGEGIIFKGDDIKASEIVAKKGEKLNALKLSVLQAVGIKEINVIKKLKIAIISTGDELTCDTPKDGEIFEVNLGLLSSLLGQNCTIVKKTMLKDNYDLIKNTIEQFSKIADIVLISGGSSVGTRDFTEKAISELGEIIFHGIALKPGKPTIFGKINGCCVLGLPGNPIAAYWVARLLMFNLFEKEVCVQAVSAENFPIKSGFDCIIPVKLNQNEFVPIYAKSQNLKLYADCDGFIVVPAFKEGVKKGEVALVQLF